METTIIIALITAIAAIVAPLITAVINNRSSIRMKSIEMEEAKLKYIDLHEREVLEKALAGIGILMSYMDADSIKEACRDILTAVAYVDSNTGEMLRKAVSAVMDHEASVTLNEYALICDALKKEISLKNKFKETDKNR